MSSVEYRPWWGSRTSSAWPSRLPRSSDPTHPLPYRQGAAGLARALPTLLDSQDERSGRPAHRAAPAAAGRRRPPTVPGSTGSGTSRAPPGSPACPWPPSAPRCAPCGTPSSCAAGQRRSCWSWPGRWLRAAGRLEQLRLVCHQGPARLPHRSPAPEQAAGARRWRCGPYRRLRRSSCEPGWCDLAAPPGTGGGGRSDSTTAHSSSGTSSSTRAVMARDHPIHPEGRETTSQCVVSSRRSWTG